MRRLFTLVVAFSFALVVFAGPANANDYVKYAQDKVQYLLGCEGLGLFCPGPVPW